MSDVGRREIKPLSHWRLVGGVSGVSESSEARAAREFAPFPARALRDRPWDISALVARQGGSDGDD
jgi:hypothetical protein